MAEIGDTIQLKNHEVEVVACDKCGTKMANIDANQLALGDLATLRVAGVKVSNPETTDNICVTCEHDTWGKKLADFFSAPFTDGSLTGYKDDDDDSGFFGGGSFLGGSNFGGFGGGSFSGGGASGSF